MSARNRTQLLLSKNSTKILPLLHFSSPHEKELCLLQLVYMCQVCAEACGVHRQHGSSGTRVIVACESPYRCCELNPDPPQEQQVLLATEPFLSDFNY